MKTKERQGLFMKEQKEFQPYIPASKVTPEITVTSIVMGIILAVVFGAVAQRLYLFAAIGADKRRIVFCESFLFHLSTSKI